MTLPTTDYSEHTTFTDKAYNGWNAIRSGHSLTFNTANQSNIYVEYDSPPNLPPLPRHDGVLLIQKTISGLVQGHLYSISLRVKRFPKDPVPHLTWYIDDTVQHRSKLENHQDWQRFVVDFRATSPTHTLTLGSFEPDNTHVHFAFDDIRIYPHVLHINFEEQPGEQLILPGQSLVLPHFTLHHLSSNYGSKTGIETVNETVENMAEGKAIVLSKGQSSDSNKIALDLNGEYGYMQFAWSLIHYEGSVSFFTSTEPDPLKTINLASDGTPKHFLVSFRSPYGKPITRVECTSKDHSYIDFILLKTHAVLSAYDRDSHDA
ncbi:hypothetical protein QEM42_000609 [Pseudomonas putida]|uniref:hypothetical protein n=1 Tax=Pseudomonas TaxID=286 RepID=UPI001198A967|nr:hypothetical protein [Pseudomonas putida]EKT4559471.1 hypothetical protein [Pseudomonas putida]MDP9538051.1 hypothetical protein [Pseudomonas putida]QDY37093.1 hypothetical protein CHR26_12850 [Pseudomonas putida]